MKNNEILILFLIGILFIFVVSIINEINIDEQNKLAESFLDIQENINNNNLPLVKVDQNVCSKQCCKFEVWPTPFDAVNPNIDPKFMDQFVGTNLSCGNGPESGGCVCMTKKDFNYIADHGQNNNNKYDNTRANTLVDDAINKVYKLKI